MSKGSAIHFLTILRQASEIYVPHIPTGKSYCCGLICLGWRLFKAGIHFTTCLEFDQVSLWEVVKL